MEWIELFKVIILIIDLKNANVDSYPDYEHLRQELGVNINTSLSGPRVGKWVGGRVKNQKIYLYFRVSDPAKAKKHIVRLLDNYTLFKDAKVRIKEKRIGWKTHAFI